MIICTNCGHQNEGGDTFCGSCGTFLEWAGERVAVPHVEPGPEPDPVPKEDERPGLVSRVKSGLGLERTDAPVEPTSDGERSAPSSSGDPASTVTDPEADEGTAAASVAAEDVDRFGVEVATGAVGRTEEQRPAGDEQPTLPDAEPRVGGQAEEQGVLAPEATLEGEETAAVVGGRGVPMAEQDALTGEEEKDRAEAKLAAARRAASLLSKPPPSISEPAPAAAQEVPASTVPASAPAPSEASVPTAHQPAAHQPAVAHRQRTTPHAPEAPSRTVKPGDLICGQCGEGNDPGRRFCRRCGASLVEAVVVKTPWWHRFLRRRKLKVKAGERPERRHGRAARATSGLVRVVVIAAVVAALALVAVPKIGPIKNPVNKWVVAQKNTLRKKLRPKFEPVRPTAAVASSEDAAHPAALAIDGKSNTYWSVGVQAPAEGSGQFMVVSFDKPITLSRIGFTIGAITKAENFLTQPRPAGVHVVLADAKGVQVGTKDVTLSDTPKFQAFRLSGRDVSKIQIQITGVNRSPEGGHQASVAEVEFFKTT